MKAIALLLLIATPALADGPLYSTAASAPPWWANTIPADLRQSYRNLDGSCVQCSLAIAGHYHDDANLASLLWDSQYGRAERGGAWPERVHQYAERRGIALYQVTGRDTLRWIEWALRNGRNCGVTWGSNHMITAVGISPDGRQFATVDNNSPGRVDVWSREQFTRYHAGYRGGWVVIPQGAVPTPWDAPGFEPWWRK